MLRLLCLGPIAWAATGCSVLDDSLMIARCDVDADCARFVSDDAECLTFGCASARCVPTVRDDDGDGAGAAECVDRYCTDAEGACAARDCDDASPSVRPGATEVCNGVDDDCNGLLDGPDEDDDRDGHADRCAGAAASDCDDDDPRTWVGAPERCDGLDNDCTSGGLVRATGGRALEPDEDADGDARAPVGARCEAGPFPKDDCDDARADVHADAAERCDGLDNDCNGVPDDLRAGEPGTSCVPVGITAGDAHACVRTADGGLVCWGASDFRLAASNLRESTAVVAGTERFAGDERHLDVAAGQDGTCAVLEDGGVRCWGAPSLVSPELPLQPSEVPRLARIVGVTDATRVVAGQHHACALVPDGVVCWGLNANGAVDGTIGDVEPVPATPIPGTEGASDVDTTFSHTCAVVGGRVRCWGDPTAGALGGMPAEGEITVEVPGIDDAVEVAVGRCFTCVRRADGSVSCLGDARYEDDVSIPGPCAPPFGPAPRTVGVSGAVSLDAYAVHACAALDTGEVRCWGNNVNRQLGDGTPLDAAHPAEGYDRVEVAPATVVGIGDATEVVTGTWHSCVLRPGGASCWGRRARHRLGDGRLGGDPMDESRAHALPVSVIRGPVQLAAGSRGTCFRMPDLSLRCTGAPDAGAAEGCYATPYRAPGWGAVLDVRMSLQAVCAITARLAPEEGGLVDREVRCAGPPLSQPFLQAADPDGVVPLGFEPTQLRLGARHACVLDRGGGVHCWGVHDLGQLGTSAAVEDLCEVPAGQNVCSRRALPVALPAPATALAAGWDHTCARLVDGRLACWGDNAAGQLGRAPLTSVGVVGLVEGLPEDDPVVDLTAAGNTTCVILRSGQTWCWGASPTDGLPVAWPRALPELAGARQLAMYTGAGRTLGICARMSVGVVRCQGLNPDGQVGGAAPICPSRLSGCPIEEAVSAFDDVTDLVCGSSHCCATRGSGQVVCWGDRSAGQCGDGVAAPGAYGTASTVDLIAYAPGEAPACEGP